jgi:hypothetical protein
LSSSCKILTTNYTLNKVPYKNLEEKNRLSYGKEKDLPVNASKYKVPCEGDNTLS